MRNGYNPLRAREDCKRGICFLENSHPRSEWFFDCFDGPITFSDMDRIVEVAGRALILEWKSVRAELEPLQNDIRNGQAIMWKRLTRGKMITCLAVAGDAKEMSPEAYRICFNGRWSEIYEIGLIDLAEKIKNWNSWAKAHPIFKVETNDGE